MLGNSYLFILLFVGMLIPHVGSTIVTLLTPGLGAGIVIAGRMASQDLRVTPATLLTGFLQDNKKNLRPLLILGAGYTVCFGLIRLLAFVVLGTQPSIDLEEARTQGDNAQLELVTQYLVQKTALMTAASIPVILLFWYAPILVVWHGMKPLQALFSSWVAVWRNKAAFVVYGLGWLLLSLGLTSGLSLLLFALGVPQLVLAAVNIVMLATVMAISFCTFYPSYTSVFERVSPHTLEITI